MDSVLPSYADRSQNRQETIHGCNIKVTKCVSYFTATQADTGYFTATQADTGYFPLFTFFITFPSLQKSQVDEKNYFPQPGIKALLSTLLNPWTGHSTK
jgi:hypothetical protein